LTVGGFGFLNFQLFTLRIDIISVLPELLESSFAHSILKRAREKKLLEIFVHPLRNWAVNEYGQVDDYQYGGGAGMVMMCEPLANAIDSLKKERQYDEIIFMSPDGELLTQPMANALSMFDNLMIISGHYRELMNGFANISLLAKYQSVIMF
jgi:tRNA (guanine37-N1)-methyltransferase